MSETGRPPSVDLSEVARALPDRIQLDGEGARRELGHLVLTLVELIRKVVEHQAVRRMDDADLSEGQIEAMGEALMELDQTMDELCRVFELDREELGIDLGPLALE